MKLFGNERGVNLVGIMVGFSMIGGMALTVMQLMEMMVNNQKRYEVGTDLTALTTEIRNSLSSSDTCKETLQTKNASSTAAGSVVEVKVKNALGTVVPKYHVYDGTTYKNKYGSSKVTIKSYALSDTVGTDVGVATYQTTNLVVTYQAKIGKTDTDFTRLIPINVEVQNLAGGDYRITTCSAGSIGGSSGGAAAALSDCRVLHQDFPGVEMATLNCNSDEVVVNGGCWRMHYGTYIGDHITDDGKGWICRIEASGGVRIRLKCCK